MANILIVDDDKVICESLADFIKLMGHNVAYVFSLKEGMKKINTASFDLVFLDVRLPDGSGLEELPAIREVQSSPEIIIITGDGDYNGAEFAIERVLTIAHDEHTLFPIHLPTHIRSQLARASFEHKGFNKLSQEKDSVNSIQFSF